MKTKRKIQRPKNSSTPELDFGVDKTLLNKFPHLSIIVEKRESALDATVAKKTVLSEPDDIGTPHGVKPCVKKVGKLLWQGPHFLIYLVNDRAVATPANECIVNPGDRVTWFQISKTALGHKSV